MTLSMWTDDLRQRVKGLWATHTATEIVQELAKDGIHVSRNSIMGIVFRAGLSLPSEEITRRIVRVANSRERSVASPRPSKPRPQLQVIPAEVVPLGLRLLDLESHHCRYAFGDSGFTFCGNDVREKSSYCPFHHALVWVPPMKRFA